MNTKHNWWKSSVIYQIYPKSFNDANGDGIGDLQGIIDKLDYLNELGIDVIWLSPVYDSPQYDNGYDIRDYHSIFEKYGNMETFDELLEEVHKRNMKLIMDLVVNHTSDEHEWFQESKKDQKNKYRNFYIWRDGKQGGPPNNWVSIFGGSAWEFDKNSNQYYLHLFAKKQPDLNWENVSLRDDIYKMMSYWLNKGIDGFRMDVINFISKDVDFPDGKQLDSNGYGDGGEYFVNGPRIHEFLKEMNDRVLSNYDVMTVGEMPGVTTNEAEEYTNPENEELNMVFTFEHMNLDQYGKDKWDLKTLNLIDLKDNFEKWQKSLYGVGWNSLYWNNHDQPRIVSRFGHDGEYRVKSAKMLALCLHLMQGTPYIYQGEEIGMTNVKFENLEDYRDIELKNMYEEKIDNGWPHERVMEAIYAKGRDNARTPMQWSGGQNAGFTKGNPWIDVNPNYKEINVDEALNDSTSIFHFYKKLISLRKMNSTIINGEFELVYRDSPDVFSYIRYGEGEQLIVICNFSNHAVEFPKNLLKERLLKAKLILSNEKEPSKYYLTPFSGSVWRYKSDE